MSRYVDLSEKVTATFYDEEYEEWTQQTVTVADVLDSVCDDYTALPTIEPRKGKWIPKFDGKFKGGGYWFDCSICGRTVPEVRNGGWNFCPFCGADMRGEQDG